MPRVGFVFKSVLGFHVCFSDIYIHVNIYIFMYVYLTLIHLCHLYWCIFNLLTFFFCYVDDLYFLFAKHELNTNFSESYFHGQDIFTSSKIL